MENVEIILAIAITIVIILILVFWNSPDKKHRRRRRPSAQSIRFPDLVRIAKKDTVRMNAAGNFDYNDVAQYMSLEPGIFESHRQYTQDMNASTSGPSMLPERDDRNDLIPWVFRPPDYRSVYADETARQVQTEEPSQMASRQYYTY